tara:strand:+ start:7651 stop:7914 length:264 start_codon:yes stop_codon:yes gene_type:complete
MVKVNKVKKDSQYKDNLEKEEPLMKEPEPKEKVVKEKVVKEKVVVKPKKSNKWVDEVKALQKKKGITYKEAMKQASLIRQQGKGGKS